MAISIGRLLKGADDSLAIHNKVIDVQISESLHDFRRRAGGLWRRFMRVLYGVLDGAVFGVAIQLHDVPVARKLGVQGFSYPFGCPSGAALQASDHRHGDFGPRWIVGFDASL